VSQRGAPDSDNSAFLDQLCDAVISKLAERARSTLTFNQGVAGSNPARLTPALGGAPDYISDARTGSSRLPEMHP